MDMLVLADMNGVVDMTHEAIARRTNRPIEIIRSTILQLEGPDERSRTPDSEGRRIERLDKHRDWGWMILNYDRFREIASDEQRREKTLSRVRKYRSKRAKKDSGNAPVTHCNAPVTPGDSGNAMQKQIQKQKDWEPTEAWALKWGEEARKLGADYTDAEIRTAFLALQASGWMWGRNPVNDHRAALERQIQTDRQRTKPVKPEAPTKPRFTTGNL
jgi:hypothetical protein